jgi:hypothetical protein
VEHWLTYDHAVTDLSALPAEDRLQALVTAWTRETEALSGEDVRKLFVFVWPDGRHAVDDHSRELLTMLRWIAPVRDIETYLSGDLTIFRATDDGGIRWTLDQEAAAAEAQDGAALFRATLSASDVLGHFTGDGVNEVLVNPQDLRSVERVSAA